ncbi:hypothetical protein AGR8A_Lc10106 [Agrobacterium fabrum str. J-07]|nr:hypothetical protein AGR8A_Lc10106 [Agrobacterium fabrum str. J-07]
MDYNGPRPEVDHELIGVIGVLAARRIA